MTHPLCVDCDEQATNLLQRASDVRPMPLCFPHGQQLARKLDSELTPYKLTTIAQRPPSELDTVKAELEEAKDKIEATSKPESERLRLEIGLRAQRENDLSSARSALAELQRQKDALSKRFEDAELKWAQQVEAQGRELAAAKGEIDRLVKQIAERETVGADTAPPTPRDPK
jgi:septal ring factor EnvC (AmiA/AmiB activator)